MPEDEHDTSAVPIVGLGASAGGLEALREFFDHVPQRTGAAFVVVTHQAPGSKSMLAELLSRHTTMPVTQLASDMEVEPDHVYVGAPGRDVVVEDGLLCTVPRGGEGAPNLPIDRFFHSLARDRRERAIGVVLSGGGSDGTIGLKEIAGQAGMVMVQTEDSARYASMPRSALAHIRVDYALPVAELPAKLIGYLQALERKSTSEGEPPDEFTRIFAILRTRSGHDFSAYKPSTMRRRVERRMNVHHVASYEQYATMLQSLPGEVERLFQELLIGVTSFFRDPESFEALRGALREMLRDKRPESGVRIWVSGCSTGEEAYSVAILLTELAEELPFHFDVQIFATDLDSESIELARSGVYPPGVLADLGEERLERFFVEEDGSYRVRKDLREKIVFAAQNMIADPPFTRLDLVVCRNVLIYLKAELQRRLLPMFHYALRPDGLLFLGPSETAVGVEHLFEPVDRKWKVFRRREVPTHIGPPRMPSAFGPDAARGRGLLGVGRRAAPATASIERLLLREALPPSVVVDRQGNVMHVHGRTGLFLEPAPGSKDDANLFNMLREGLGNDVAIALRRAEKSESAVHYRAAKVKSNGGWKRVGLHVRKLQGEPFRGNFVVSFEALEELPEEEARATESPEFARLADVEAELRSAKEIHCETAEELETANEELKSANEELQSTNEELQSTNEELETSKEELQSLNEELQTVNTELHSKLEDLSRANDDMRNLLNSTDIATIFLDGDLNIKRYTERAKKVVRLIPSDIGRPIGDLVAQLEYDRELVDDAREVLDTLVFKEAEVRSRDGDWYLMRILPYRTTENVIDGLVITFVDLTSTKQLQSEQRRILAALARSPTSVFGQDIDLRYQWSCDGLFGVPRSGVVGKTDHDLLSAEDARRLSELKRKVIASGERQRQQLKLVVDGAAKLHDVFVEPVLDADGETVGVSGVVTVLDSMT